MAKRTRIGLYSPYVPKHVGGGERQFFSVAEALAECAQVEVLLPGVKPEQYEEIRQTYAQAFHLNLNRVQFTDSKIGTSSQALAKLFETARYDVLYYLTDGSLFFSLARRNILHIQFPFTFEKRSLIERLKLANWGVKRTDSLFEKQVVERAWNTTVSHVHYPYVESELFVPGKKENIILNVGRFFMGSASAMHCKRQDVLVEAFRSMVDRGELAGWKLVLIGGIDPGQDNAAYAAGIDKRAQGYPIKIFHEASFDTLARYNASAAIYWHAAGYQIDEEKEPTKVEHFGITILEAMASGAVPIVIEKGGAKEIITVGVDGMFWKTTEDLATHTLALMQNNEKRSAMATAARERALFFNKEQFVEMAKEMAGCA